jgi:hypothetical protein
MSGLRRYAMFYAATLALKCSEVGLVVSSFARLPYHHATGYLESL